MYPPSRGGERCPGQSIRTEAAIVDREAGCIVTDLVPRGRPASACSPGQRSVPKVHQDPNEQMVRKLQQVERGCHPNLVLIGPRLLPRAAMDATERCV
eukprot:COSAG02_NODE_12197_length_1582_cov_1.208361_1_plen_97_part_10